jgi:hypothetical protein
MRFWALFFWGCAPAGARIETDPPEDSDDQDGAEYRAIGLATALNRVAVYRETEVDCAWFVLVNPVQLSSGVRLPPEWSIEWPGRGVLEDCSGSLPPILEDPVTLSGSVDFEVDPNFGIPAVMDVDLTLGFSDGDNLRFLKADLAVEGW